MTSDWRLATVDAVAEFDNRLRIPLSAGQRAQRPGIYPYWGANGPFDTVDDFLFEGDRVLVAEDGNTVVRPDGRGTVHWATGRYWVNNHAHVLNVKPGNDLRWLFFALSAARVRDFVSGSAQPKLSMGSLKRLPLVVPPPAEQLRISSLLGALDDKIDSNRRLAALLEETAETLFRARFVDFVGVEEFEESEIGRIPRGWRVDALGDVTALLTRGRAPAYVEDSGVIVVNQKCIRDRRISYEVSRRNDETARPSTDRRLRVGDVLVNSTGVGTLGRVAQVFWLPADATVDGHVTMIRADDERLLQDYMALDLMQRQADLEGLAQGSTGQTELSRARLAQLAILTPPKEEQRSFVGFYQPLRDKIAQLERESVTLTHLRNSLLPKLISGEIRVPDTADLTEMLKPAAAQLAPAS